MSSGGTSASGLIDTGGYETDAENVYAPLIVEQIKMAMAGAALVLFCVDARDGLTASDYDMADVVRRARRPTIVVATKADNERRELIGIAEAAPSGWGADADQRDARRERRAAAG